MSGQDRDSSRESSSKHGDDEFVRLIEEFMQLLDGGAAPNVDEFCARLPSTIRAQVREQCVEILSILPLLPPREPGFTPGYELHDFRILREIGHGGMGYVYLALQKSLHRLVAVKILPPHFSLSEQKIERFRREVLAVAKLSHPAIVPIHSVGQDGGTHYFVMEYVRGRSLAQELDTLRLRRKRVRAVDASDRLDVRPEQSYVTQVCEIAARIARALDYAHRNGVVHRDIKPHNILINEAGAPFLVDFGLAKDAQFGSLSKSGDIAGTPHYMSPEQAMAKRVRVDHRTDIFSLGIVIYEALTLRRPFEGKTANEVFYAISFKDPRPIRALNRDVPRDLQVIVNTAIEKSPERRYPTAEAMALDLERFLRHESIVARPPSIFERGRRQIVRHRTAVTVTAAAILALSLGGALARRGYAAEQRQRKVDALCALPLSAIGVARPDELHGFLVAVTELEPHWQDIDAADREQLDERRQAIRLEGERLRTEGRAQLDRIDGRAGTRSPSAAITPVGTLDSYWWLISGTHRMRDASLLLPSDDETRRACDIEAYLPRLRVTCDQPGALVSLRDLTPLSDDIGPKQPIGTAPIEAVTVLPGYYRVIVEKPGVGFCEFARYLDEPGRTYEIAARLRPTSAVAAGMAEFPQGPFLFGAANDDHGILGERTIDLRAFRLDEREVSNADYRAFVLATGYKTPLLWQGGYDEAWNELPITGIACVDATAYAEWVGKRLPTQFEWERAARGTDGRLFPWGHERGDVGRYARMGGERVTGEIEYPRVFARNAVAVSSFDEGRTPEGILHLFDNVSEWTESMSTSWLAGVRRLQPGYHVIMGGAWINDPENWTLVNRRTQCFVGLEIDVAGFRCAMSVEP